MSKHLSDSGKTFALVTLGCKVNQYETHALREAWLAQGHREAANPAEADLICVNTCAVTARAVVDVRAAVRRAHRAAPNARIVVTGCAAQVLGEELAALPGVTLLVPQQEKHSLNTFPETTRTPSQAPPVAGSRGVTPLAGAGQGPASIQDGFDNKAFPPFQVSGYDRARAMLKVQDGCSHRCTYCIVPLTRGASRSRLPEDSLAEARRLLGAGFRELTVSGINLAQYGRDLTPHHDFWDLLALLEKKLAPEWAGRARLRISSLEPGQLGDKALETLGNSRLIAPHLHLSLQSGSRSLLKRMGRGHYAPAMLEGFCRELARVWPLSGLGADILTAFPGETEEEFTETLALCQTLPFSYAHVFPYSRRPGTPAADWPGQLGAEVKKARAATLRACIADKKAAFLRRSLDSPQVLVVRESVSGIKGVNEFYLDCVFEIPPKNAAPRELVAARPVAVDGERLVVRPLF